LPETGKVNCCDIQVPTAINTRIYILISDPVEFDFGETCLLIFLEADDVDSYDNLISQNGQY